MVGANSADAIDLEYRARTRHADIRQWFYFRVQGARGQPLTMRFLNAGEATYAEGWQDYQAVACYDRENWFRVPTTLRRRGA